jgi:hypothetical protein
MITAASRLAQGGIGNSDAQRSGPGLTRVGVFPYRIKSAD